MTLDPRAVARALGGDLIGRNVLAPGPGHSHADRSLSIKIDPRAREGFIAHSFAGDSAIECRGYVRSALRLATPDRRRCHSSRSEPPPCAVERQQDSARRSALSQKLWGEAHDPRSAVLVNYLTSRGLSLTGDIAGDVIRFHPSLKLDGALVGAVVALFRDIRT